MGMSGGHQTWEAVLRELKLCPGIKLRRRGGREKTEAPVDEGCRVI